MLLVDWREEAAAALAAVPPLLRLLSAFWVNVDLFVTVAVPLAQKARERKRDDSVRPAWQNCGASQVKICRSVIVCWSRGTMSFLSAGKKGRHRVERWREHSSSSDGRPPRYFWSFACPGQWPTGGGIMRRPLLTKCTYLKYLHLWNIWYLIWLDEGWFISRRKRSFNPFPPPPFTAHFSLYFQTTG